MFSNAVGWTYSVSNLLLSIFSAIITKPYITMVILISGLLPCCRSYIDAPPRYNNCKIAHFNSSGFYLYPFFAAFTSTSQLHTDHSFSPCSLFNVSRFTSADNPSRQRRRGDSPGRATMDANLFRISVTPRDQ